MSSTTASSSTTTASSLHRHRRRPHRKITMPKTGLDFETHHRRIPPSSPRSQEQPLQRRSVSFGESVTVHWHKTILGDHPSPRSGPPIALGWNAVASEEFPLVWENQNRSESLRLSPGTRIGRLQRAGVSFLEMHLAIAEGKAIRCQRDACRSPSRDYLNTNINSNEKNIDSINSINNFAPIRRKRLSSQTRRTSSSRRSERGLPIRCSLASLASYRLVHSPERAKSRIFDKQQQAPSSPTSVFDGPFGLPPPQSHDPFRRAKMLLSASRRSLLATAA